ncbi:MAG: protein sorting system archaetidylserine synthase [Halanaeroarchaeum sp.]
MRPRFVGHLGVADWITATNAGVGFVAVVAATVDPALAARIVLLGGILDALDGIVARWRGGTTVGPALDSLADVASFGVAPALVVFALGRANGAVSLGSPRDLLLWVGVPAVYVAMAVVRLGLYTVLDLDDDHTEGVQSTLAATLLAAGVLVGATPPAVLAGTAVLAASMVVPVSYPDLRVRDAFVMGTVQALAVVAPTAAGRLFPTVLLTWAVGYLFLSPWVYRRREGKRS